MPAYGVVVGDPLYAAVKALVPGVTGYKVDYPASFSPGSVDAGRDDVVKHMTEQPKQCPNQKYVMVGYSQGADVMHNGLAKLTDPALHARIVALVMFGDPGMAER
jgi:cutinase